MQNWNDWINLLGGISSFAAAIMWVHAAKAAVPLPARTDGQHIIGITMDGMIAVPGPKGQRLNLYETLKLQSIRTTRASYITAASAFILAVPSLAKAL